MWPRAILILICLMQTCTGITVTEKSEQPLESSAEEQSSPSKEYRVSVPKPQRPANRVPAHLQGINRGYVYDDADDVIHIIEPPQHFRELKRLINQKGAAADVWQQRSQVRITRPQASASTPASVERNKPQTKVKDSLPTPLLPSDAAKVEMPMMRLHNTKPAAVGKNKRRGADLQTQESKVQPVQYIQHYSAPMHAQPLQLPMEILASVRKTERLRHTHRAPLLPLAKQRHKSKKTHTVISEKGYEHAQFQRGKEIRLYGEQQAQQQRKSGQLRKSSRIKREIRQTTLSTEAQQVTRHAYNTEKGHKLLQHISELLKNATYYLPDEASEGGNATTEEITTVVNTTIMPKNTSLLQALRGRFQHNTQAKSLIGEIEHTQPTTMQPQGQPLIEENVLIQILENSLNATDAIMSEIMRKNNTGANSTAAASPCGNSGNSSSSKTRNRFQSLQYRINCMREQVFSKTAETTKNTKKRFGDRTREKVTSATLLQTTTKSPFRRFKNLRKYERIKNLLKNTTTAPTTTRTIQTTIAITVNKPPTLPPPPPTLSDADVRNISAALLYDDIMTNIRNMLQARNLRLLEEQQTASDESAAAINIPFMDAAPPAEAEQDESDFGNFRDLNRYLNELKQIVASLPKTIWPPADIVGSTTTELTLNSHELSSGTSSTYAPRADWYLINGSGKIYQTHLNDELKPTATIFHRFPDIPYASEHLRNRSLWAAQSKSFEIL